MELEIQKAELNDLVLHSLERAGLIDEVKDRLDDIATGLSGGQQQKNLYRSCNSS